MIDFTDQKPARILYVDDSENDRILVRHALLQGDIHVELTEAADAGECARYLQESAFDLVLTDFDIGDYHGLQVLEMVQRRRDYTPVVFVTGTGSEEVAVQAMKRGAADYVLKTREQIRRLPEVMRKAVNWAREQREHSLLRELIDNAPDFIGIADHEHRVIYINQAGLAVLGLESGDLYSLFTQSIFPPQTWNWILHEALPAADRNGSWEGVFDIINRHGERQPVSAVVLSHRNDSGETAYRSTIARDISSRVAAEKERDRLLGDLRERVKELSTLHRVTGLLQDDSRSEAMALLSVVRMLPAGWRYPDIAAARIIYRDAVFHSEGFRDDAVHVLSREFHAAGTTRGIVEIVYLEPVEDEPPFLVEEERLADSIAALFEGFFQRRTAQNSLKVSEARYRDLVNNIPDVIWTSAEDGTTLFISDNVERVFGFSAREIIRDAQGLWFERIHPDDVGRVKAAFSRLFRHDEPFIEEYRIQHRDGHWMWISDRAYRTRQFPGRNVAYGIFTDISERHLAEEALRLREHALESSRNGILIATADQNPVLVYANPAFEHMTGYSREEVQGSDISVFLAGCNHDRAAMEVIHRAMEQQKAADILVQFHRRDGSGFWNDLHLAPVHDSSDAVSHFVAIFHDISEVIEYQTELERQATHDQLTGLVNRSVLADRLEQYIAQARRSGHRVGVAFMDLDNFKLVNDTWGHQAGDRLLVEIARRVSDCIRAGDTLARPGGDEFVLVMPEEADGQGRGIQQAIQRIRESLLAPVDLDGREVSVTCSIGVSLFPDDGEDGEALLKQADMAMYRAKESGRDTFQFYTSEMQRRISERVVLETNLRHALDRNELELHYQPQVELETGQVHGFEALLRWHHPELGMVSPVRFMPLAEETGLIIPIGTWVMREARRELAWRTATGS